MTNSLVLLDSLKAQLNIDETNTTDDVELQLYADASANVVEDYTGLVFDSKTFSEEFKAGHCSVHWVPSHKPVTSLTSVTGIGTGEVWDISDVLIDGDLWFFNVPLHGVVKIEYMAGGATATPKYKLAALIIAQHLWETQRGNMPMVGADLQDTLSNSAAGAGMGFAIPNRALELLGPPMPGIA